MNIPDNVLNKVKYNLGITGEFQDDTIKGYIEEVAYFLIDAGANEEYVMSPKCIGLITRGVSDLWGYGAGDAALSPYFMQRAIQVCSKAKQVINDESL